MLFPLCLSAQTRQSDSLFARGVELYTAGRFAQAIPVFEAVDSLDKATIDSLNDRRYYGEQWLASCLYHIGQEKKAREVSKYYKLKPVDRRLTVGIDSLSHEALALDFAGEHGQATYLYKQAAELGREVLGSDNVFYANLLCNYGFNIWEATHEIPQPSAILRQAQDIYKQHKFYDGLGEVAAMLGLFYAYSPNPADKDKIPPLYIEAAEAYEKAGSLYKAVSRLRDVADFYLLKGNYEKSVTAARRGLSLLGTDKEKDRENRKAVLLSIEAEAEFHLGRHGEAAEKAGQAKVLFDEAEQSQGDYYTSCVLVLTSVGLEKEGKDDMRLLDEQRRRESEQGRSYGFLRSLVIFQCYKDVQDTWAFLKRYTDHVAAADGTNSATYFISLIDAISYCNNTLDKNGSVGIKDSVWNSLLKAESLAPSVENIDSGYVMLLYTYKGMMESNIFFELEDAVKDLEKARSMAEDRDLQKTTPYRTILLELAGLKMKMGKNDEAFQDYSLLYNLYTYNDSVQDVGYFTTLDGLRNYYEFTGDTKKADEYYAKLQELAQSKGWNYLLKGDNDARLMSAFRLLQQGKADETIDIVNRYLKGLGSKEKPSFIALMLGWGAYMQKGNFKKSLEFAETAYHQSEGKEQNASSIRIGSMLAVNYILCDRPKDAYTLAVAMTNATDGIQGLSNDLKASTWMTRSLVAFATWNLGDKMMELLGLDINGMLSFYRQMLAGLTKTDSLMRRFIADNFLTMTYEQRTTFWNKNALWFQYLLPSFLVWGYKDNLVVPETLYNSMLLSKGLLLNSETEIRKMLAEHEDDYVRMNYQRIEEYRAKMDSLKKMGGMEEAIKIYNDGIHDYERELLRTISRYGDYTQGLLTTYADVTHALKDDEVAIEIVPVPLQGDTAYYALTTPYYAVSPDVVQVCKFSELKAIPHGTLYSGQALYELVWKKIEPVIDEYSKFIIEHDATSKGIRHLFFSPAGSLYNIALENALMPNGQPFNTKYDVYRVSSTREVVLRKEKKEKGNLSVLYGGLRYDASTEDIAAVNERMASGQPQSRGLRPRAAVLEDGLGGGVPYLKGTRAEVDTIDHMLEAAGRPCEEYTDDHGTEESVKTLSGKPMGLLHIATHGFYWDGKGTDNGMGNFLLAMMDDDLLVSQEDRMLTRSGLILAGANTALQGGTVPEEMDDGILTSQELSQLDFNSLDLVVLSACETGLGEVNGEGVFGLQRGFKKAGAHSILMSLWKVDDEATCTLMTEFYKHWIVNGQSKYKALELAKQAVRARKDKGWDNPRYWAAFVLLDAAD